MFGVTILAILATLSATHVPASGDVCYGYLGCFSMSSPWFNLLRTIPAPQSPEKINTQFYLQTRNSSQRFNVTKLPNISLLGSNYDGRKPTFILSHGFFSSGHDLWIQKINDALLSHADSNVIIVDWEKGAANTNYYQTVANIRVVAAELIRLVKFLINTENASPSRLHLIGHSLGAQIMSYVGKNISNIARITALEPAQPGFEGYVVEVRLDKTDALFVEVIHTNAKPYFPLKGFGMMAAVGHVDFYMNGGWDQPGCNIIPPTSPNITSVFDLAKLPADEIHYLINCSHDRSHIYFLRSITGNCTFWGHQVNPLTISASIMTGGRLDQYFNLPNCTKDSCSPLGLETINYPARGSFFVATTGKDPFCISEPASNTNMPQYQSVKGVAAI